MSSTRNIISPPPFAANALTVIPPTPVAGVSYRDPVAGPASSPDGWPYAERVNSAEFNQIMYQLTSLASIQDKKGILGWSNLVDYPEASVQFGSDGILYLWIQASGPSLGGARDPVSNPTYWAPAFSGRRLNTQKFDVAGTYTYTPTMGTKTVHVQIIGGGGAGGGAAASPAGAVSVGSGGGGGGYSEGVFNVSAISGQIITVGAGGVGALTANGGNGSTSSIGSLITAGGGGGGIYSAPTSTYPFQVNGAAPGIGTLGSILNARGVNGYPATVSNVSNAISGLGGDSFFSGGSSIRVTTGAGNPGALGAGGSGALVLATAGTNYAGGNGGPGFVILTEYS